MTQLNEINNSDLNNPAKSGEIYNSTEPDEFDEEDSNIDDEELDLLDESNNGEGDDELLKNVQLDDTDEQGELLNESTDFSGDDLDVPGSDIDNENELIGEEDEENNLYSEDDQENKL